MAGKFDLTTVCPHITRNNERVLDILQNDFRYFQQYLLSRNTKQHIVQEFEQGRLDLISYTEYNTVEFWWVLARVNGIIDPLNEVVSGVVLKIPSILQFESYLQLVKSIKRGQSTIIR